MNDNVELLSRTVKRTRVQNCTSIFHVRGGSRESYPVAPPARRFPTPGTGLGDYCQVIVASGRLTKPTIVINEVLVTTKKMSQNMHHHRRELIDVSDMMHEFAC